MRLKRRSKVSSGKPEVWSHALQQPFRDASRGRVKRFNCFLRNNTKNTFFCWFLPVGIFFYHRAGWPICLCCILWRNIIREVEETICRGLNGRVERHAALYTRLPALSEQGEASAMTTTSNSATLVSTCKTVTDRYHAMERPDGNRSRRKSASVTSVPMKAWRVCGYRLLFVFKPRYRQHGK